MKLSAAAPSLLARLRHRPKALLLALVAALALMVGPILVTLAEASTSKGDHMPCDVLAGMSDHAMMGDGANAQQHDKSGGCAFMQGAVCLTMVGVLSPMSASIGRLPPRLISTPAFAESAISRAVFPPHRPPKHV